MDVPPLLTRTDFVGGGVHMTAGGLRYYTLPSTVHRTLTGLRLMRLIPCIAVRPSGRPSYGLAMGRWPQQIADRLAADKERACINQNHDGERNFYSAVYAQSTTSGGL